MLQNVKIQRIDFSDVPDSEKAEKTEQFIGKDIRKLFDIENEPLYRLYLIKTGNDEVIFHLTVHHIVFDGWSWGIFVKDLKKAYSGFLKNEGITLSDEVNS